jgi:signal transduction histidine kinase
MSAKHTKLSDVWDRWTPIWHAFFYVMMATATGLLLTNAGVSTTPKWRAVGLVGVLAGWHWTMMVRSGAGHRERPRRVGVYLAGAMLLSVLLVRINSVFLMVAMTLFNQVFAFLVMRWALPAAFTLMASIALTVTRTADPSVVVLVVVGSGAALLFSVYLTASAAESQRRRELIEELERAREQLAFAERLAGRSEERGRIARELHDTVTQQLVGIVMKLEAAGATEDTDRTAHADSLSLAREALAEARRLVWAERPTQLEKDTLTTALTATARRVSSETGMAIETVLDGELDTLQVSLQTLMLRAVQEALANVKKHARARHVTVSAAASESMLTLDVQDDGVGFDGRIGSAPSEHGSGFGLRGLRDRVEAAGGELVIESERGRGTTLAGHVPLRAGAHT